MWQSPAQLERDAAGAGPSSAHGHGIAGWIAWIAATIFVFYQLIVQNSYVAMDATLREALELDLTTSSLVSAAFLVAYGLMQVPAGLIIDRLGPGRVLAPAALVLAGCTWLFASVDGFWSAVAIRAAMGCVAAFAFPGAGLIARRRLPLAVFPLAIGIIDGVFGLGLWVGDDGVNVMLEHMHWRSIMGALGVAGVVVAVICLVCIRPIGPSSRSGSGSVRSDLRLLVGKRQVVYTAILYAMMSGITFGFAGLWNIPLQEAWGFSRTESIQFNGWIFIGMAVFAPLAGLLGMRRSLQRPVLVGGVVLTLIGVLCLLFLPTPMEDWFVTLVHVAVGMGLGTGVLCFAVACRTVEMGRVATAIGLINAAGLLAAAFFQVLPGIVLDQMDTPQLETYQIVLSIFAVGLVVALPLSIVVTRRGQAAC
jgi:MFS family permease